MYKTNCAFYFFEVNYRRFFLHFLGENSNDLELRNVLFKSILYSSFF